MPAHLLIVHFPIALVVVGAMVDAVGTLAGRREVRRWGGTLLMLGAAAALLAFWTGQGALDRLGGGASLHASPTLEAHTQWGGAGVWPLAAAGMLRAAWRSRLDGPYGWANLAVAVLAAALVVAITLSGTAIRHAT